MTPSLQFASVQLRVRDLARSLEFYVRKAGFSLQAESPGHATLGASPPAPALLELVEDRTAEPAPRDSAGLFHAALLFDRRAALGGWLKAAAAHGVEFDGLSDHGVSEAVYFSDPDGNGLEFYADQPRAAWPYARGELAMVTRPLALPGLLAEAAAPTATPLEGARWGHLHLRVTDLERSDAFYRATLGLAVTQRSYPGARFLAADGYHHHLGLNTWGHPRRPRPAAALGLLEATVALRDLPAERRLADPDGIVLRLQPAH